MLDKKYCIFFINHDRWDSRCGGYEHTIDDNKEDGLDERTGVCNGTRDGILRIHRGRDGVHSWNRSHIAMPDRLGGDRRRLHIQNIQG